MKDAQGHGSNSRGGAAALPAHQSGIMHALMSPKEAILSHVSPDTLKKVAKYGAAIYAAQAGVGIAAGIGWALVHTGVI